ncbi:class I SAM-dependent methyltransferase [Rhodococcus sp. 2G]|uniref:class I SAM-dependent methyltransferase n=1 Tax=Rhodococcus sp. 2G TaxID=1570939 RepID=UPI0012EBF736|nr:class I SAM-dependent methyltransferase [Rhodococcus sp. 2G]
MNSTFEHVPLLSEEHIESIAGWLPSILESVSSRLLHGGELEVADSSLLLRAGLGARVHSMICPDLGEVAADRELRALLKDWSEPFDDPHRRSVVRAFQIGMCLGLAGWLSELRVAHAVQRASLYSELYGCGGTGCRIWSVYGQDYFAEQASGYNRRRFRGDDFFSAVKSALSTSVSPSSVVADIGCGTGALSEIAVNLGAKVVATDISRDMLREFIAPTTHDPQILVAQSTCLQLPMVDEAVDCAIEHEVFCFAPSPVRAALEALRVVKDGGVLLRLVSRVDLEEELKAVESLFHDALRRMGYFGFRLYGKGADAAIDKNLQQLGLVVKREMVGSWSVAVSRQEIIARLQSGYVPYLGRVPAEDLNRASDIVLERLSSDRICVNEPLVATVSLEAYSTRRRLPTSRNRSK